MAKTLFEKIWDAHLVKALPDGTFLIYIDRIFLHERTGSIALQSLAEAGRKVRHPERVFCTMDHIVDTFPGRGDDTVMPSGKNFIQATRKEAKAAGITLFDIGDDRQGIAHVISPEMGIVQPGITLVCPDSHTCTQGAMGAAAWGIGSSEAEHAMATQTLRINKPKLMRVVFEGELGAGVTAKDMILHLIGQYGANGGAGYAIEFAGSAVENLSIEGRLTLCNMAVEFAAFTGLVAPDQKTYDYLEGRTYAPKGKDWDEALTYWQSLVTESDAAFDKEIVINASDIEPTVTWGTSPQHAAGISQSVPALESLASDDARTAAQRALDYQGLASGDALAGLKIDNAFIGSCTNARIEDLRSAASILKGRKVAAGIKAICVPGSQQVKAAAEREGLDKIFEAAGFEWRESGCSMCFFAGGEHFGAQERVLSTSNRNFESRQGPGTRTHLASPATVAASAINGVITDPRTFTEVN
ncbi:3-isopropylmalate dehydratase large subunit [Alteromonas lipolytica]|uniref:3-isopropylmalate dehydratase n=1 Tax=Alteromonas lipolytica TaxID=1856405 RepID=A0A1E8FCW4_9ALTE|nr:3-isopropylmalate dehydratase large subunit [Alteromonas lipolytica]OFI33333.1 3-isopropylmalate dehydratase large subunit [Alteromonas lipolytica]GGF60627.1 3-isopropylmalate dehydratase large subunit 1 [Alteromonas lipolytica]